jgi:hypothetical protein
VVNPASWSADFLEFDYIGAPTHRALVKTPTGLRWSRQFEWADAPPADPFHVMMNGGFSLRSRRCLRAPAELGLPLTIPPVHAAGDPLRLIAPDDSTNEDVQLCGPMRSALESAGVRFAPPDIARRFAFEQVIRGFHDGFRPAMALGQHSRLRRLTKLSPPTVTYAIPEAHLNVLHRECDVVEDLVTLGYRVEFPALSTQTAT